MRDPPTLQRWLARTEELLPLQLRRDPVTRRRALLALGLMGANTVILLLLLIPLSQVSDSTHRVIVLVSTTACLLLMNAGLFFLRRGSLRLAGNWLCFIFYLGLAYAVWQGGGVAAPFAVSLVLLPMLAGIIAGRRSGLLWGSLSVALAAGFYAARLSGWDPPPAEDPWTLDMLTFVALASTLVQVTWMTAFSETMKETAIAQIEHAVQEEEAARLAAEQAIAANTAKSAFLATMSHELRTPLNAILGYSELVIDELRERGGNADLVEDIRKVHTSGRHLLGLITDILDLTRIEAARFEFLVEEFDPAALLREVAEISLPLAVRNNDVLTLDVPDGLGLVAHDATRVRQVVINLVGNAIKFTRDGLVTVRLRADPEGFEITVEDTGIGIPVDKIDRIFEPFTQVDASTTRRFEGSGLGLAVCRRLVALMGGSIDVRSSVGRGSAFTVRLPRRYTIPARPALETSTF